MIIVKATVVANESERENLLKIIDKCVIETRKEEGCLSYEFFFSSEDENVGAFFEQWENKEALDAHMKALHFIEFIESSKPYLATEPDIKVFTVC